MKGQFLQKVSNTLTKTAFKIRKASPELLIIGGVIGVIGAAVGACCATRKIDTILEDHRAEVEKIHSVEANDSYPEYTHKDAQHDLTLTYVKTTWKLVKLYAPSFILGTASLGCMFASNHILRKRNAALLAAYSAVDGAFRKYRKNVVERFGEEVDKQLRFNTETKTIEEEVTDENGKKKKVKRKVEVQKPSSLNLSDYARCFGETNPHYKKNAAYNRKFILDLQRYFQWELDANGHVFLNDVYKELGFPKTKAGQSVGWTKYGGDGYIDFGISDVSVPSTRNFIYGYEPAVWLDFNVDGPILDEFDDI